MKNVKIKLIECFSFLWYVINNNKKISIIKFRPGNDFRVTL